MEFLNLLKEQVLDSLEKYLNTTTINTWIEPLDISSYEDDLVTFQAPNSFTRNVSLKYIDKVDLVLKELLDESTYCEIVYDRDFEFVEEEEESFKKEKPRKNSEIKNNLNPKYTFENFVTGASNTFANAACKAVAKEPATTYNPLFLYSGVGLGKTHLMQAVGHEVLKTMPESSVVYVSSEKFTNELINSIRDDKNNEFRDKYRNVDILIIDDIQFIAGKESTQEEFFHTFNALYENGKQIIISSDRPPKDIPDLEDRLVSRFEWGLTCDIQPPDFETRMAILRKKADMDNIVVDDEVFEYISNNITSNIRELEGALLRVVAYASLTNAEVNERLASEALKDFITEKKSVELTPELIKKVVGKEFDVTEEEFVSRTRKRSIAYPRQIAMYLTRELTDLSLPRIGDEFGGRDHSTVLHAYDKVTEDLLDEEFAMRVKKLREKLESY